MNIVLHQPEIPANTGNIGRTCVATGTTLHLIEPLGFRLNEKDLKRAGMDYWDKLDVRRYINFEDFLAKNPNAKIWMATTKAKKTYSEVEFGPDDYIMFGKESAGIPEEILVDYEDTCVRIPMLDEIRSLNLSNSVSIILYEALRQNNFAQMKMEGELHHLQWKNNEDAKKEKRETRKRRIKKAGLISLIISTILMFANFLLGKLAGNILGIILWGGEMSDTIGFGVRLFKTYPMSAIDEPVVSSSSLYFEPISFIITVLLIMVIAYPICCSIEKRKKK